MKRGIGMGVAFALLGFSVACEELAEVTPSDPQQKLEERTEEETPSAEPGDSTVEEEPLEAITKYIIKKGEQHATLVYESSEVSKLKFKARFDSTAIYQSVQAGNQGDINKLYGVSDCNSYHHTNSARFGWRWYNNQLEILAYTYADGVRKFALMDTVSLDALNEYEIEFTENQYIFRLNNKELEMPRSCAGPAQGYKLFPYFGGDEMAPHDISIWIEELKE